MGNAVTVVDATRGNVLSLDGDGDYVDCGNPAALNFGTNDWSLSAYVKTTIIGTADVNKGSLITNGGDGGGGHRYGLVVSEQQEGEVTLVIDDNDDDGIGSSYNKKQARGDATKVNDDVWHHVLGVREGDTIRIYIDGIEEGSTNIGGADYDLSGTDQNNVLLGAMTRASNGEIYKTLAGMIDDAQIYNCALTEGNARFLADIGDKIVDPVVVPPVYGPLLAHYEFEGNANDSTDNHYDGSLQGDASIVDGALVLDGDGDYVNLDGYKGVTGTNAFSISAWLKKTATEDSSIVS
ncbi:MAG: LamG domain-containing protein, partial [Planctomycetota bacterium]